MRACILDFLIRQPELQKEMGLIGRQSLLRGRFSYEQSQPA